MQIINLGNDYATITGGFVKKGQATIIDDWELPIMRAIGAKVEIIEERVAEPSKTLEEPKPVKKKKKC